MTEVINKIVDKAVSESQKGLADGNLNLRSVIFQAVSAGMSDAYGRGRKEGELSTQRLLLDAMLKRFDKGKNKFTMSESLAIYEIMGMNPEACMTEKMKGVIIRLHPDAMYKFCDLIIN